MPKSILPKDIETAELSALQQAHGRYDLSQVLTKLGRIARTGPPTQAREASEAIALAQRLREAYPHLKSGEIVAALAENYRGPVKLGGSYKRDLASALNAAPPAAQTQRRTVRATDHREKIGAGATVTAASTRDSELSLAPAAAPPHQVALAGPTRPYVFNGNFAGTVFKSNVKEITAFFGAISSARSMEEISTLAGRVRNNPAAPEALARLTPADRKIYQDVINWMTP